jgi:hypothetical protein
LNYGLWSVGVIVFALKIYVQIRASVKRIPQNQNGPAGLFLQFTVGYFQVKGQELSPALFEKPQ